MNRRRELRCDLAAAALLAFVVTSAAPVLAQGRPDDVLPPGYASVDAPGVAFWALTPYPSRHQLLIDANEWPRAVRGAIDGLQLRRNAATGQDTRGGRLHVTVDVSFPTRSARDASPDFAANRGPAPVRVFDGMLDLAARPARTGGVPSFDGPDAVTIPFVVPVALPRNGTLLVETTTVPFTDPTTGLADSPWWPIDALVSPDPGAVTDLGLGCIPGLGSAPAGVDPGTLAVGGTARFPLRGGASGATAWFGLGFAGIAGPLPLPFDLGPLGAPGCSIQIAPLVVEPRALTGLPGSTERGLATAGVELPIAAPLVGRHIATQWFVFDPSANALGLTTSNGVLGALRPAPSRGIAWVRADDTGAATGTVIRDRVPVLRFRSP